MQRRGLTYGLLVAVAVAMGVVTSGLPRLHQDAPLRAAPNTASPVAASTTTVAPSATTSTAAVAHAPATVTLLVANASEVNGAAAKRAATLKGAGYRVLTPVNTAPSAASEIFFKRAADADARAVASTLGIPDREVHAMPVKAPIANVNAADVVVVIGRDLGAR